MLPQSRNTTVRSAMSAGGAWIAASSTNTSYSGGSGRSSGETYMTESLPSACKSSCIATSEPSASPSGCSCVASAKRSSSRIRASTSSRVPAAISHVAHEGPISVEDLLDSHARDRSCRRRRTRAPACASGAARPPPGPGGSRGRWRRPASVSSRWARRRGTAVLAEHAHVHARMAQIGACPDVGHRYESHSWVLQSDCHGIPDHLANRLIHSTHASCAHPTTCLCREEALADFSHARRAPCIHGAALGARSWAARCLR